MINLDEVFTRKLLERNEAEMLKNDEEFGRFDMIKL